MKTKSSTNLIALLQPFWKQRLFPWLIGTVILFTTINFYQHGILEPVTYPSVDFRLYHNWIRHQSPPVDEKIFQPPFLAIPYTPFWAIYLLPFAPFPFSIAKQMWYVCNLAIVFWFVYLSIRWIKEYKLFRQIPSLAITIPVVLFFNYMPIMSTLRVGQANLLTFLFMLLSIFFFLKNQKYLCGFFLALAILTKLTPSFLILYWLIKREYRVVLATLASVIILWLITIPLLGWQFQIEYLHWFFTYPVNILDKAQLTGNNMSIYALVTDFSHSFHLNLEVTLFLTAIILMGLIFVWYRRILSLNNKKIQKRTLLLEYGWTVALIPLLTHYTEHHHLVNLCLLYSSILLFADKNISKNFWFYFGVSWILINGTFSLTDLFVIPRKLYILLYLNIFGAIMAWICGYVLLSSVFRDGESNE